MYVKEHLSMISIQNFKLIYWKTVKFCHLKCQKDHFSCYFQVIWAFLFSVFLLFGLFRKCLMSHFPRSLRRFDLITCITTPKLIIYVFTFLTSTLDDLDSTWGHQKLRRVLKNYPRHDPCCFIGPVSTGCSYYARQSQRWQIAKMWPLTWLVMLSVTLI